MHVENEKMSDEEEMTEMSAENSEENTEENIEMNAEVNGEGSMEQNSSNEKRSEEETRAGTKAKTKKKTAKKALKEEQKQENPVETNTGESSPNQPSLLQNIEKYVPYILLVLGILFAYNMLTLWNIGNTIEVKVTAMEIAAIPVDITMTIITAADCDECFNIHALVAQVGALNVNVTVQNELAADTEEAQALIEEYHIKTLPAVILGFDPVMVQKTKGNEFMEQLEALGFKNVDDETDDVLPNTGYKYEAAAPPYYDVVTEEVKGLVSLISITTADCDACVELGGVVAALEKVLTLTDVTEVAYGTEEAQEYMEKYSIETVPTFIISEDAGVYEGFAAAWKAYGVVANDGSFVFQNTVPPYIDGETGEIRGLVDVTYVTDESCSECYNVTVHKVVLKGFGIVIDEETTIDIGTQQGQALLKKYGITKVPTIILSEDAAAYAALAQVWEQVGEIAEDGSYVFTNMEQLQGVKYTDLEENADEA